MLKEVGKVSLRHHGCVAAGMRGMTVEGAQMRVMREETGKSSRDILSPLSLIDVT